MRDFFRKLAVWAFHIGFARPVLYLIGGVEYRRKNLLPDGPCLVVSNHNSHLDAALLMTIFPLRRIPDVHPVAAADYFGKTWFLKLMAMVFMNALPISRAPSKGSDPLAPFVEALKAGKSLVLFPEGSRGEAGVVAPFRPGVGRLARRVPGLKILPVFLSGPERIWPRGQYLPVPVAIDAYVGKPRSYDPELEAREIANKVREDVLALAPSPSPRPSARPLPPLRVAICSINHQKRETLFLDLLKVVGAQARSIGLGVGQTYEALGGEVEPLIGPVPFTRARAWVRPLAWVFRAGGLFQGEKFAKMMSRAQLSEALQQSTARHLVSEGSTLVDLAAWTLAYSNTAKAETDRTIRRSLEYLSGARKMRLRDAPRFLRRSPELWLVNTFDLARPPVPDVVVHLKADSRSVLSGMSRGPQGTNSYQTVEFLDRFQAAYSQVGEALRRRMRCKYVEIEASEDVEQALARVLAVCRELRPELWESEDPQPAAS